MIGFTIDLGDMGDKLLGCQRRLCGSCHSRHCDRPDHRGRKRLQAGYDLRNAEKEERQLKVSVLQCKQKPECMFYEKYGVRICTVWWT